MNKVILMGRLTRDPEVRYTQSAEPLALASFSIAVDRPFSSNRDSNQPTVDFFNCTCWGKRGENIGKYFKKGNRIVVVGRIQNRTWVDQNNQKRYSTDIVVDEFEFCETKASAAASTAAPVPDAGFAPQNNGFSGTQSYEAASKPNDFYDIAGSADDEDLPF
jgi:single-strand DNA-binding protein